MKYKKTLSFLLASLMGIGSVSFPATAAQTDDLVGYSNQGSLENYAKKAYYEKDLGCTYSEGFTTFKTWSPEATSVKVKLYKTGSDNEDGAGVIGEENMTKDSETGVWSLTLDGDHKNQYYTYIVNVKGKTNETQDVYAKAVGVNGKRSMIVDLSSTNPEGWDDNKHVVFQNAGEAVVWEVHVRDFSASETSGVSYDNRGKYLGFTELGTTLNGEPGEISTTIDYLVEQGINCVQLMPIFDFQSVDETNLSPTNRNWGYDPQNYNAPEGSYSSNPYDGNVRIKELKQLIQALHDRKISVVMDVVYNHTYNTQSSFEKTVPGYYYRMTSDSTFSNGSGCGNETASDKLMFRKFMIESCQYWMDEYHIDGFRFDLMGLHDVTTMNAIRSELDKFYADGTGQKILMYGEPWTGGDTCNPDPILSWEGTGISRLNERIGAFGNRYRDAIKGDPDGDKKGFVQGYTSNINNIVEGVKGNVYSVTSPKAPAQAIAYADAHDNLIMWDKIVKSNGSTNYKDRSIDFEKQMKEIYTLLLTSQGIPFMTAGSEFGRTKQGDPNSYKSPDSINAIDWGRVKQMADLAAYYKGLLAIRKNYSPLHSSTIVEPSFQSDWGNVVAYTYTNNKSDEWNKLVVLVNGGSYEHSINLDGSDWVIVANGTHAGVAKLGEVSGSSYTIPAKGCAILVDKASFDNLKVEEDAATLTVNHVDTSGEILKTQTAKYKAGMTYRATPDEDLLFDYKRIETQGKTSGIVAANGTYTVTFQYKPTGQGSGYVNVTYVDGENGKQLVEPERIRNKIGEIYTTAPVSIPGYQLDTSQIPLNATGVMMGDVDVKYVYTPLDSGQITIHYNNTNQWSKVHCYAYCVNREGETIELTGHWNDAREMTHEKGNEYTIDFEAPNSYAYVIFHNGHGEQDPEGTGYLCSGEVWIHNGIMSFDGFGKVTIHYKNTNHWSNVHCYAYCVSSDGVTVELTGSWNDARKMTHEKGDEYKIDFNAPNSYAYVIFHNGHGEQDPEVAGYLCSGEVSIENSIMTFDAQVITHHIDAKTGQKIAEDVVQSATKVKFTDSYTTSPLPERTDYIASSNAKGKYAIGTINVVYYYGKIRVGNLNFDGKINVVDATWIQRIAAGIITPSALQKVVGDVDGDGKITIMDATMVQRYAAGLPDTGNVGKYVDNPASLC